MPDLEAWGLQASDHLVHGISHPARAQGGMVQAGIAALQAQLLAVAEVNTQRLLWAAGNIQPSLPIGTAYVAPAAD